MAKSLACNVFLVSVDRRWMSQMQSFPGNTTHPDDFKLLLQDGDYLLVGAR